MNKQKINKHYKSKGCFHNLKKVIQNGVQCNIQPTENFNTLIYLVINKLVNFIHIKPVK